MQRGGSQPEGEADKSRTELTRIAAGIRAIPDALPSSGYSLLRVLNLHSNQIRVIEGLSELRNLEELNLSSNDIEYMEGLSELVNLVVLNLSANNIRTIKGINKLLSLKRLILSYNRIESLAGLEHGFSDRCALMWLDARGNELSDLDELSFLTGYPALKVLLLASKHNPPMCQHKEYASVAWRSVPSLDVLDSRRRDGSGASEALMMDYLADSGPEIVLSSRKSARSATTIDTPRIDSVLNRRRAGKGSDLDKENDVQPTPLSKEPAEEEGSAPARSKRKIPAPRSKNHIKANIAAIPVHEEARKKKESSKAPVQEKPLPRVRRPTRPRSVSPEPTPERAEPRPATPDSDVSPRKQSPVRGAPIRPDVPALPLPTGELTATAPIPTSAAVYAPVPALQAEPRAAPVHVEPVPPAAPAPADTVLPLLEAARATAEAAAKAAFSARDEANEARVATAAVLARAVAAEREALSWKEKYELKEKREAELVATLARVTQQAADTQGSLARKQQDIERLVAALDEAMQRDRDHKLATQKRGSVDAQLEECQNARSMAERELALTKRELGSIQDQLRQLQATFASREDEYARARQELVNQHALEMKETLLRESRATKRVEAARALEEKAAGAARDMQVMEDELKKIMQANAAQVNDLKSGYMAAAEEATALRVELNAVRQREAKALATADELAAAVQDLRNKMATTRDECDAKLKEAKTKHEAVTRELHQAQGALQAAARGRSEAKAKEAELAAKQAMIEALQEERKNWKRELSDHETAIFKEKGAMESKIQSLDAEVARLTDANARTLEALRVKELMLDDQNESLRVLKQSVADKEAQLNAAKADMKRKEKTLDEQLEELSIENQRLRESRDKADSKLHRAGDALGEAKEELVRRDRQLGELKAQLTERDRRMRALEGAVEQTLVDVQTRMAQSSAQHARDLAEKDREVATAQAQTESLRKQCDAVAQQMTEERAQHAHLRDEMSKLSAEADRARRRTATVEEEMRVLLRQAEVERLAKEEKMKQLGGMLQDLYKDSRVR